MCSGHTSTLYCNWSIGILFFWVTNSFSTLVKVSLVAQMVKNLSAMPEIWFWSLGQEGPLEKGIATHSNILAWRIPWIEEPGGLYSPWGCRVAQNETNTETIGQLRPLVVSYNHYQSLCDKRHTLLTLSHQGHIW